MHILEKLHLLDQLITGSNVLQPYKVTVRHVHVMQHELVLYMQIKIQVSIPRCKQQSATAWVARVQTAHTYIKSWKRDCLRNDECFTSALVHLCVHGWALQTWEAVIYLPQKTAVQGLIKYKRDFRTAQL
jgi:hypothetical protein